MSINDLASALAQKRKGEITRPFIIRLSFAVSSRRQPRPFLFGLLCGGLIRQRLFMLAAFFAALQITAAVFIHLLKHEARAARRAVLRHRLIPEREIAFRVVRAAIEGALALTLLHDDLAAAFGTRYAG